MEKLSLADLTAALNIGLVQRICVECGMGYGDSLQMHLGDHSDRPAETDVYSLPRPAVFSTLLSSWLVQHGEEILGRWEDETVVSEQAIEILRNRRVIAWTFLNAPLGLDIQFEDDYRVKTLALNGEDIHSLDAWRLVLPDGRTRHIRCDGRMYITDEDELYTEQDVENLLNS